MVWKRLKKLFSRKKIDSMIFFITTRCNSRCKHCFYWKNLNKENLELQEIEKILDNLPKMEGVLLSGGEPFLREDIGKIIGLLIKKLDIKSVGIPTNGILYKKITKKTREIAEKFSSIRIEINCSLDGLEKEHEYLRGVKGNFKSTVKLIKNLVKLKREYPNLRVTVNTVITNRNHKNLKKLIEFVKSLRVDTHTFDIIRGEHKGILKLPKFRDLKRANNERYKARRYYNSKKSPVLRFFSNLKEKYIILTQQDVLKGGKWGFRCFAGRSHITLDSDGQLKICELTEKIGSLKSNKLEGLLKSKKARRRLEATKNHKCDCTHICYVSGSINKSGPSFFKIFSSLFRGI